MDATKASAPVSASGTFRLQIGAESHKHAALLNIVGKHITWRCHRLRDSAYLQKEANMSAARHVPSERS